jgi:uncharacterized protein YggE
MRYGNLGTTTLALALVGALSTGCAASNATRGTAPLVLANPGDSGILVDGHGEIAAAPDVATLSLGVEVTARTVADAREQGADAAAKVIGALKADKVDAKDIQTDGFSIQPRYEQDHDHPAHIVGYTVTNNVVARVRDLRAVSRVVDDATNAGGDAVRVHGIAFEIEDGARARASARERAVADARQKAEQLAKLTGVDLAAPIAVEEVGFHTPVVTMSRAALAEAPTPIEPGEDKVTLDVRVRWAIKGGA